MTGHVQRSRREFLRLAAIGATGTAISLLAAPAALAAPVSVPGDNAWYAGGPIIALRFDPINLPGPIALGELSLCDVRS